MTHKPKRPLDGVRENATTMTVNSSNPTSPPEARPLPAWPQTDLVRGAEQIVRTLQEHDHQALFVGGSVRNWLLGQPLKDVDVATSAHPDSVAAIFPQAKAVGAHFGVMLVKVGGIDYEVATFRTESAYADHRRPSEVRYGTLEEDYQRRDFTVNAMYFDPVAGRLVDPAVGRADLDRRVLRAVGDPHQRFHEDALRLMRAVRFAVRYELEIEPLTFEAIRAHAPTLRVISAERVSDELLKTLSGPHPGRAMHLFSDLGLWPFIIPEVEPMKGCEQPANFHPEGDVFVHTALVLEKTREAWGGDLPQPLALAALLHDVGKPPTFVIEDRIRFPEHQRVGAVMADEICKRLRLSNKCREIVVSLVENHMRFMDAPRMKTSTLRRFLGLPHFELHLALHKGDCLGSHANLDNYHFCIDMRRRFTEQDAEAALLPPPLAGGQDLKALGLKPGPIFKELLDALRDEQLEGRVKTREEALEWLAGRANEAAAG